MIHYRNTLHPLCNPTTPVSVQLAKLSRSPQLSSTPRFFGLTPIFRVAARSLVATLRQHILLNSEKYISPPSPPLPSPHSPGDPPLAKRLSTTVNSLSGSLLLILSFFLRYLFRSPSVRNPRTCRIAQYGFLV